MITVRSEPTTAKGIMFWREMSTKLKVVTAATYPDALVQLDLLLVVLLSVEGVQADAVVHELLPNLYRMANP